jgi:plasmid replication initiation protein
MAKLKGSDLVVKANKLIEARYRLSLVEQQLVGFAITRAREEQRGLFADHPITIRAADFAQQFNCDDKSVYEQLKDGMARLYERSITLISTDDRGLEVVTKTRWISQANYINGAGEISFIFAPLLVDYVTRLDKNEFTQYKLSQVGNMTSWYAVRIYELLVQYLTAGSRTIRLDELKKILCIEAEYSSLKNFKARVVDVAIEQINEHTDLSVGYEQIKKGRVVEGFNFKIKRKPQTKKQPVVDRAYVEAHALPGETYEIAKKRLLSDFQREIDL